MLVVSVSSLWRLSYSASGKFASGRLPVPLSLNGLSFRAAGCSVEGEILKALLMHELVRDSTLQGVYNHYNQGFAIITIRGLQSGSYNQGFRFKH